MNKTGGSLIRRARAVIGFSFRDFPAWLFNDVPEREPKYAYRSLLVIFPVATISIGVFVWALISLPLRLALPIGAFAIGLGFWTVLRLVDRIVSPKFPTTRE
jgi:hypothetical protein